MDLKTIHDFFHKNMHIMKKKEIFERFQIRFFPMLVERPYFGGAINPKTYLNHESGSKIFYLSILTYKLMN